MASCKLVRSNTSIPRVVFVAFSLLVLFYLACFESNLYKEPEKQAQKQRPGLPVRLVIPAIDVNATVQYVGVTPTGEMAVPSNSIDVGWFRLGPHPGEVGSAVIAGHLNDKDGKAGVFANLHKLKEGDKLYVEDDKGISIVFIVREIRSYDSKYADEVFTQSDKAYLNLITCDGTWDGNKKSYSNRLVVLTSL